MLNIILSADGRIITCRQIGHVKLKCMIRLDHLFPDQKSRERFDYKWKIFIEDSCNNDIYRLQGNTLSYDSEQLIPTKTNGKPSLLLVLGNPASESVKRGMFFATNKDGKELRFWEHILERSELLTTCSLLKMVHAAMRSSTATRELTTDLRGTGKSIPKLSSIAA